MTGHVDRSLRWLGAVPSHWRVQKLRHMLSPFSEKNHPEMPLLSVVREKGVIVRNVEDKEENHNYVPDDLSNYKLVRQGQFAMNKMKAWQGSYGVSQYDGIVSPAYFIFDLNFDMNPEFFHRAIRSKAYVNYFAQASDGIRVGQWDLSMPRMKEIPFLIPPRAEQDQIVRFLDWKVSEINRLIASKRKQISLIREYRTTMINNAVTQGVRNSHLKSSGMNWLPQIPANWETIPAKALFAHIVELRHEQDEMLAATQKYGMIAQKEYMALEGRRIVLANDNLDKWLHVEPDDFIISLRSFQGGLEVCTMPGCVTWHYVVLRPKENVYVPYFKWLFKSASYIGALQRTSDFIRDGQDLRFSNFIKVRLLLVPLDEQREIAEYLDKKIPLFDVAEKKISDEIVALQEIKARLISDVVTGKIDVRGIEVPEYEPVTEETEPADEDSTEEEPTEDQED